ncbi:MAG TPA: NAD(P)/FAD-dependent oxidoreductase [Intrasporangium sp.]|nr:NAD(P)/FAD-dependent oxidoreductase [Intrasporangium sp.]
MTQRTSPEHLDVVIVGAGIAGIDAAYRLQTELPAKHYVLLETRDSMGGTWDLFRYPGVRSDSDLGTLGFPFDPWTDVEAIAGGDKILAYVKRTAARHGIDQQVRFGHRVVAADWSSDDARWTLTVQHGDEQSQMTCSFLHLCSGYYDYDRAYRPDFPGEADFTGTIVHPQFWPETIELAGRRVIVIGSGATSITLAPALARLGAHPTILQRSPSWVMARPRRDRGAEAVRRVLPHRLSGNVVRYKNALFTSAFYQLCQRAPGPARTLLTRGMERGLGGDRALVEEHFAPRYDPWDERLCIAPDGDLFRMIGDGRGDVVTDTIDTFTARGVRLSSGRELPADIIVTATGLRLLVAGGVDISVDGERRSQSELFVYRGLMLGGVPNLAFSLGYVNASWTLRADLAARYVCRLLAHLDRHGLRVAVPQPPEGMARRPLLPLHSGYVRRATATLPAQGDRAPWLMRQSYLPDRRDLLRGDVTASMAFR